MLAMPKPPSQQALLWVVAACFFMQTLDTTIVNTALPAMARSLGEEALALKPVVVAYTLTMAMLTPASGWLADRYGTRRVYLAAILVFAVGSIFCALAQTLAQLTIARVVQGVGGSMLLPIGRLAVLRTVPGEQYISALAFVSIAGQVGPIFGPTLGGLLVQAASWHWIFMINVPIGIAGLFAVRRYLPEDALSGVAPFDVLGCGLLSLCMAAFSLALDLPAGEGRMGWSAALFGVSALTVPLYMIHARRRENPLFKLRLFGEPNFSVGLAGNLACRIGSSAVPFLLPLLLQLQLGYTPLQSGLMMLPAAIAGTVSKPWIAPLVRRFGYDAFLLVNTVLVGASIMSFAAMNSVTLKGLSKRDAGSGNSLFSMVQMLAIGLGVTIGGGLVDLFSGEGSAALGRAFSLSFLSMGAITLLSAWIFRRLDMSGLRAPGGRAAG